MSRNISKYKKSLSNVDSKNSFHTKNDPHSRHVSREINNLIGDLYEKKKDFTSIKEKQTEDLINISNSQLVELVNREVENRNLPDDFDLDGINLEECFRSQFKKNKSPESIEDKFLRFSSKRIKDMEREPLLSQENFWNGVDLNRFIYDTVSQKKMKEISPASNNWEKRIQIQKETDFNINSVQNNQGYLTKQSTVDVQIPFRQLHSLKENCVQLFDFFIDKCKEIEILKMELRELREVVNLRNNFLPK